MNVWWVGLAFLALGLSAAARAGDLQVRSPIVEYREWEFEHNAFAGFDRPGSPSDGVQTYTYSIGYGVLPFWKVELEAETGVAARANQIYAATTLENTFQLLPEGEYAVDLGMFAEYSQSNVAKSPNSFTLGPIIRKELTLAGVASVHTVDVFLSRDVGHDHTRDTGLSYAAQSRILLNPMFNPGLEAFGAIGDVTNAGRYADQQHSLGPVITGEYSIAPLGKVKYELGYQAGLTSQTARSGVRWKFEYEIAF